MSLPRSILLAVLTAGTCVTAQRDGTQEQERFETEVRPLLARRCFSCHGSDKQRSELRLDHLSYALHGGARGAALAPGHPEASRLVTAIGYEDVDLQMPPKKRLDDAEIAILTEWIARGAYWPDEPVPEPATHAADATFDLDERRRSHWAWREPQRSELPAVRDTAWPLQPVDRFVLARLEDAGLEPAADADRQTWLRRVTFDLTGLPPTPNEIDAFVGDDAGDAFEKVVDRMLGSRHFGERWARHWLDLVRYSETLGHEYDYPVPYAWRYRDYVVRAINGDVPYDQFVREHVAGDLLPQPRRNADDGSNESVIGTAFYWFGDQSHSPVDARQATADRIDNQVDVLGKTFLGLTLGCARCHDHKFDAISTRDYYAMVGYLQSSRYSLTTIDPPDRERATLEHLAELQERLQRQARDAFRGEAARIERYLLAATAVEEQRVAEERSAPQPAADDKRELTRAEQQARDRRQRAEQRRREAAQQRRLAANATRFDVDAAHLQRWLDALGDGALRDAWHPLHAWRALTEARDDEPSVAERWQQLLTAQREPPTSRAPPIVFADFDAHGYEGWHRDGLAFGSGPCRHGDSVVPGPDDRVFALALSGGWAHSGRLSRRLQGTLHSPTFDIEQRYLHVFAAGHEARINVVLDGFNLIRAPIYGDLKQIVNADDPRWFTIDLAMWRGHRAYLQFNDFTTPDPGDDARGNGYAKDGFLAVQRVVFSDDRQPPVAASADVRDLLGDRPIVSREALAQRYARAARQALDDWQAQRSHPGVLTAPQGALLNWLFGRELLRPDDALRSTLQLYQRLEATIPPPTLVPAMTDGSGENARVNIRGNPNELGDAVPRRLLQALDGVAAADASSHGQEWGSGRLQLANAMTDRRNPLLARTLVNRVWHHLFGRGLVATTDNFGVLGGEPTHPQLLDWLAEEFVEGGWSIKATIRAVVLSRTYRMASTGVASADAIDPDNALLHRMRIRRLQGEVIRDAVLAVSGRLDPRPFGPGVPVHLTRFMEGRGRPDRSGPLDGDGRRSIYLEVRRNFLNPMFVAFDTPPPFATVGCRSVSNVPAQALAMLNDPFVHEQAERWAARVLEADMPPRERVQTMYRMAFGRRADAAEANAALAFLLEQSDLHGRPHDDLRSWTDLAHVLLNTKEFVLVR